MLFSNQIFLRVNMHDVVRDLLHVGHFKEYFSSLSYHGWQKLFIILKCVWFFPSRYRIQYESLLQVEKEQNEFIEDFGIK